MAQKKRGTNPIRITLTEDQISDIIQSAAKTRRGLRIENLEDRIAPSAIGAPMFGDPLNPDLPPTNVDPLPPGTDMPPTDVPPIEPEMPPTDVPPINDMPPTDVPPINDMPPTDVPPIGYEPTLPPVPPAPPAPDLGGSQPPLPTGNSDFLGGNDPTAPQQPHVPTPSHDPAPVPPSSTPDASGAPMPSSEEIEEHRRNILRQLRGN